MKAMRRSYLAAAGAAVAALGVGGGAMQAVAAAQTTATARCHTSQLRIWRGDPGDGAAGSVYYQLEFTNVSSSTCSLDGYPGVAAVGSGGHQLGSAAGRDRMFAPAMVKLGPGATAHAVLRIIDVDNLPKSTCEPTTAAALRIYPPNATRAATLPFRFRACAKSGPAYLLVRTVRPRVGVPGYSH
jgi:hypothetical protein